MITTKIKLINKLGLHARASAKFVALASRYQSQIEILAGNQKVNGKSIMGVMMLAGAQGTEMTLNIEGPDEEEMSTAITNLINNRFGEPE